MNTWKFNSGYDNYELSFEFSEYSSNGATAVLALPYTNVSVNMEHAPTLPKGQFYLKDWSGNEAIAKAMIDEKLIEPVEGAMPAPSGYIVAHAYQFTKEGLKYVENAEEFLQHFYQDKKDEELVANRLRKNIIETGVFLDEGKTMSFVDAFMEYVFQNESDNYQRYWTYSQIKANFRVIHRYAESPIEKIFLCNLNLLFFSYGFFVTFTPPLENAEEFPNYFRARHTDIMKFIEVYQMTTGINDIDEIIKQMDNSETATLEEKEIIELIKVHVQYYSRLGMYDRYQLSLQPTFQTIKVDGKLIRPDLLIWIPSKPYFKLVVECDGYDYHSDKVAFSRDRARDRILQSRGYQVFRFSGHEIYNDPIGKSKELCDYLMELEKNANKPYAANSENVSPYW